MSQILASIKDNKTTVIVFIVCVVAIQVSQSVIVGLTVTVILGVESYY